MASGVSAIIVDPADSSATPELSRIAAAARIPLVYVNIETSNLDTLPPEVSIVVVQDHLRIIGALRAIDRRGVPVVLLVSDVRFEGRKAVYVGIDNESAGRTAGFLLRQSLGGRRGTVLTVCRSGRYANQRQRVTGLSRAFGGDDRLLVHQGLLTNDEAARAEAAVRLLLDARPDVVGICHTGGGNTGVGEALELCRPPGEVVYVGHELYPASRALLAEGTMRFAIDQEPERQVRRAIDTALRLVGLSAAEPDRSPIPFRILTPENMD